VKAERFAGNVGYLRFDQLTVSLLISYLLPAEQEQHLHDIYSRLEGTTHQYWTSIEVSGKRYLGKPVYRETVEIAPNHQIARREWFPEIHDSAVAVGQERAGTALGRTATVG